MNSHQRRIARRRNPEPSSCGRLGYSGTTTYPDLMCVDGMMIDQDGDGYDPTAWHPPCPDCQPVKFKAWREEVAGEQHD